MTYTALSNMPANVAGSPESGLAARSARPAAVAAGRVDLPLPAALRLLLRPGRLHAPPPGTGLGAVAPGAEPGARARRRATGPVGRRATAARRPRRPGRACPATGFLHQPDRLRRGPDRCAPGRAARSRARPYTTVIPGLDAGTERLPVEHPHLRPEAAGGPADQGAWLPDGAQLRAAPAQPGPCRRHHRDGAANGRRIPGTGQYAVLRLGLGKPARPDAHRGATAHGRGGGRDLPRQDW